MCNKLSINFKSKKAPQISLKDEKGKTIEEKPSPPGERRMKVPARSHREYLEFISMNKYPLGRKVEIVPYTLEEVAIIIIIIKGVDRVW